MGAGIGQGSGPPAGGTIGTAGTKGVTPVLAAVATAGGAIGQAGAKAVVGPVGTAVKIGCAPDPP